jgi:hypothetical protein
MTTMLKADRRWRWLRPLLTVIVLFILALLAAPQLWYPLGFDQAVYAACGDVIRRGGIPIQDCFETKQAGVMVMYAIPLLLTRSPIAIHAFTLLWTALTALLIAHVARRVLHPAAAWPAGVFYWLMYAGIHYWSMDQGETFANLFLVLALYGALSDFRFQISDFGLSQTLAYSSVPLPESKIKNQKWAWLLVGGASIGVAFWFKYVFGLIGMALVVCIVIQVWLSTRSVWAALGRGLLFGLAVLVVVGAGVAYYALNNALPALVSQFQFLQAAFPLGPPRTLLEILAQLARFFNNGADVTGDFKATVPQWIVLGGGFPFLFVLAALGVWRARHNPRVLGVYGYLSAMFLAGAAVIVWQANYIQYHYTILLPPLALGAAGAFDFRFPISDLRLRLTRSSFVSDTSAVKASSQSAIVNRQSSISLLLAVVAIFLLALRMGPWVGDAVTNGVLLRKAPRDIYLESREAVAANVPVAEFIASHTQPTDTIAIFGDAPWVYTLAERRNATRFCFINLWLRKREAITYPLFTQQFADGLQHNQPLYFLITKPDFPWPNNDYIPDYKATRVIYDYVESHYAYEGENGPFLLFRRKS